ncbi:MAG: CBS domain-containing protein [Desulfurococcales archaeon]|nr:CBS domain-containing protein [Desulfurococcales archaeon]
MDWTESVVKIMSSPPVTIKPSDRLVDATRKMYQSNIGSIVVVDENNHPVGILTKSDFLYFIATGIVKRDPLVKEVMRSEPVVIKVNESIKEAYERMKNLGIRHLPVVNDEGEIVGVISMRDILIYVCKPIV